VVVLNSTVLTPTTRDQGVVLMKMKTFNQLSTDDSDPLQQPFVVVQNSRTVSMKMETFNEPSTVDNAPYDPPLPY